MAKFGEGDPRWLVQDRKDGTNVNNWHWSEKDCTAWAKNRLGELLGNLQLVDSNGATASTTQVTAFDGEAVLNVRKNKLVAAYELSLKVGWKGTWSDGSSVSGTLDLPYIAEENHDEDPEIKIVYDSESKAAQELKAAIQAQGRKAICAAVATFVKELHAGTPVESTSSSSNGAAATTAADAATAAAAAAAATANGAKPSATTTTTTSSSSSSSKQTPKQGVTKSKTGGTATLRLTEKFYARASDIYDCFVVEGKVRAFTQSAASVAPQPGGSWSWFGGSIAGTFQELVPNQRLVMSWRFSTWEEGVTSKVTLEFKEPDPGNTIVTLLQEGIPEADKFGNGNVSGQVEAGWQQQVFSRIRAVFGYGV